MNADKRNIERQELPDESRVCLCMHNSGLYEGVECVACVADLLGEALQRYVDHASFGHDWYAGDDVRVDLGLKGNVQIAANASAASASRTQKSIPSGWKTCKLKAISV
eukprot:scaffold377570_cov39-Prasinocladus_malaysianus.AAC.1